MRLEGQLGDLLPQSRKKIMMIWTRVLAVEVVRIVGFRIYSADSQ